MENKQIIAEIEDYAKDITRLLIQIVCDTDTITQAKDLTLNDFTTWQTTRLKRLKNVCDTKNPNRKKLKR